MKGQDQIDLVDTCAKMASKANKIKAYVITYSTKKGVIHTIRGGDPTTQIGLVKIAKGNVISSFSNGDK